MIYTSFTPAAPARPSLIAVILCRGAYPLDCRTPDWINDVLERLPNPAR